MRARVLPLGLAGTASALITVGLLPAGAVATPTVGSGASVAAAFSHDLGVAWVSAPSMGEVDQTLAFQAKVTNVGTNPVDKIAFTVTLPSTFGYVSHNLTGAGWDSCVVPAANNSGHIVCKHMGPLPAGESARLDFRATPQSAGEAIARAAVSDAQGDDKNKANDKAKHSITVKAKARTLAPPWQDDEDPGYPYGWFHYGPYGYDDYDDWCEWDCY